MSACTHIYSIVQEAPSVWLPPGSDRQITVTNVLGMYIEGTLRKRNYEAVALRILQSVNESGVIGYVTYGNPLAYDSVSENLVRQAQQSGISFRVVPGICSVDTLLCDLGVDMAPGIQVYDASWLVAAQISLNVSVTAILLQMGAFGSLVTHYRRTPKPGSLAELVVYLRKVYDATHEVHLIRSSHGKGRSAHIKSTRLSELCDVKSGDLVNCSMFIPPLSAAKLDESFLARMHDT